MNDKDIEKLKDLISLSNQLIKDNSKIIQIINEEAEGYFNGEVTVERAVECIQNRVDLYVNEHM